MNDHGGNLDTRREPARVALFGMRCAFTEPVLDALLAAPVVDLRAVVLPRAAQAMPTDPVSSLASRHAIPVLDIDSRAGLDSPAFRAALESIAPAIDLVVVACFPWRLPASLLSLPAHGCVNVHPSLLPDGRGPEPVFWAFRRGLAKTGVTLHLMDAEFDTGPIIAQRRHAIPADATIDSLELDLARLGARLLIDTLPALPAGSAIATPQDDGAGRPAPFPTPGDLVVPTLWSASRAARFIRAVAPTHGPLTILVQATGQRLAVGEVIGADDAASLPEPVRRAGPLAHVRFTPGVLTVRLHALSQPLNFN